jgi:acyl dehydratase
MAGLWYEEFEIGHVFRHEIHRTVTETDNILITTLTHNPAAIHLDYEYSKTSPYGKPLMNSAWTLAYMTGVTVGDTTLGTTIANLGWDEVRFPKPVFIGDTLRAETTVMEKRESKSRSDSGIVVFKHTCFNQRDEVVAHCLRSALMYKKSAKK